MNRNRTLLVAIMVVLVQTVTGQQLFTYGGAKDLHVVHKVAAKDTWYSISRTYNLTPKEIAAFNNLSIDKPLEVGQSVNVPLNSKNFSQSDPTGSVDDLVPIYHLVQEKEWMYRISVNHNKVPIEKLERWNNITRDQAKAGMKLIVGFLSKEGTAAANTTASAGSSSTTPPPSTVKTQPTETPTTVPTVTVPAGEGGYFKSQYDENGKNQKGVAGVFKSTSGWKDGKYYALMNNVTVGTIVKVNYPSTNKWVYAKVLGELPDMKESAGLSMRISDAAARELGAVTNKFSVEVKY
jgi:LysM repeat protein